MDFQTKIGIIDEARLQYPEFEAEFKEYIASGNSINGAYNFFSIDYLEKYNPKPSVATVVQSKTKVQSEAVNVTTSNVSGNKKLPERKNS